MARKSRPFLYCFLCVAVLMARQPDPAAAERPAQAVSDDAVAALLAEGAYDRAESLAESHFKIAQNTF